MREAQLNRTRKTLTAAGSTLTASMLRDIERNAPIEADHIVGDLSRRGPASSQAFLQIAYTHLKAYEARRARTLQPASLACPIHEPRGCPILFAYFANRWVMGIISQVQR